MRFIIIAAFLLCIGCATVLPATLEYKSYENPKGGIIFVYPQEEISLPTKAERKAARENEPKRLMAEFCAPEPSRVVAEGYISSITGADSMQFGTYTVSNVKRDRQEYLRFECGAKPRP